MGHMEGGYLGDTSQSANSLAEAPYVDAESEDNICCQMSHH